MKGARLALLLALSSATGAPMAHAQQQPFRPCWSRPAPQTVEEAVIVSQNASNLASGVHPVGTATLALSDGRLKTAYGAGLLVGWGETGRRPEFSVVTAVGMSALLAPFAFIGRDGDAAIANIFACEAASVDEMVARAIAYIDRDVLERIAQRHLTGARLLVALPGSAARPETVWDIGAIAASKNPKAGSMIGTILRAAIDLTTFIDPGGMAVKAGVIAVRNPQLRHLGAGEAFLYAPSLRRARTPIYLVHNGVLFADESADYASQQAIRPVVARKDMWLLPAYEVSSSAQELHAPILIASPRAHMNIQTQQSAFDSPYMHALFLDTYRRGRMNREWRQTILDARSQ